MIGPLLPENMKQKNIPSVIASDSTQEFLFFIFCSYNLRLMVKDANWRLSTASRKRFRETGPRSFAHSPYEYHR